MVQLSINLPHDFRLLSPIPLPIKAGQWTLGINGPVQVFADSKILHIIIERIGKPELMFPVSLMGFSCAGIVKCPDSTGDWYAVSEKPSIQKTMSGYQWNLTCIKQIRLTELFVKDLPKLHTHWWKESWIEKPKE